MITTIVLAVIMIVSLFVMLLAGVALIQDKRLFTSAPRDIQEVIHARNERFKGQHFIGC